MTLPPGFQAAVSDLSLTPCQSGDPAPDTWSDDNSSNTTAGQVACGAAKKDNAPALVWTNDKNHMLGGLAGSGVASLYQWWQASG